MIQSHQITKRKLQFHIFSELQELEKTKIGYALPVSSPGVSLSPAGTGRCSSPWRRRRGCVGGQLGPRAAPDVGSGAVARRHARTTRPRARAALARPAQPYTCLTARRPSLTPPPCVCAGQLRGSDVLSRRLVLGDAAALILFSKCDRCAACPAPPAQPSTTTSPRRTPLPTSDLVLTGALRSQGVPGPC